MQPSRVRPLIRTVVATSLALLAACGGSSSTPSAPTLTSVTPTSGPTGGGTAITVTGTNFVSGATVTLGGASATGVTVNGATSIAATAPAHAGGPVDVVVTNPDGRSATLAAAFTYQAPSPGFAVTSVSPTHGAAAGGTLVTLTGTGFRAGVGVEFDTSTAATIEVVDATTIRATSPAHGPGAVDVTVVDLDATRRTLAGAFTFDAPASGPVPTIASVTPPAGDVAGGASVAIAGTNFVVGPPATAVTFGGSAATVTVNSPTSITATTPPHAAGAVDLTVANPDGNTATKTNGFTYTAPAPTLTAVAPTTGHAGSAVALTGTGFQPNATVTFGGVSATVVSASDTTINVDAPAHAPGTVDVRVANPDGQGVTLAASFTYVAPPTLTSVSPTTGSTAGGDAVTLIGTGFVAGAGGAPSTTVSFGGTGAAAVAVNSATSMTVTTPAHLAGAVDVRVTNPDGQVATVAGGFTFNAPGGTGLPPPPVITTLDVTSGPTAGGTVVHISGTFTSGTTASFGGVPAVNCTGPNVSGDPVTCTTPAHAAGVVDVSVKDAAGQVATKVGAFTFTAGAPTITALNVNGAPPAGGTTILIVGTNFDPAAIVTFGGVASPSVVLQTSATQPPQLVVRTPPQPDAREFVPLVVTNPDGQSVTAPSAFGGFHYGPAPAPTDFFVDGFPASKTLKNGKGGQLIDIVGSGFSLDRGVQVQFSGPSSGLASSIDPRSTSALLIVGTPTTRNLNPGNYVIVVTNFDGQFARVPGTLVVQ